MMINKEPQNAGIWTGIEDTGDYEESKDIVKLNMKNEQVIKIMIKKLVYKLYRFDNWLIMCELLNSSAFFV